MTPTALPALGLNARDTFAVMDPALRDQPGKRDRRALRAQDAQGLHRVGKNLPRTGSAKDAAGLDGDELLPAYRCAGPRSRKVSILRRTYPAP